MRALRSHFISDEFFSLKIRILGLLFFRWSGNSYAQKQGSDFPDSLKSRIPNAIEDTNKVKLLAGLSFEYFGFNTNLGGN